MIEILNVITIHVLIKCKTTKLKYDNVNSIGSEEILDDVIRHGYHVVFWCYPFEREISNFVNIPSNQINNEMTYNKYFSRYWCTKMHRTM